MEKKEGELRHLNSQIEDYKSTAKNEAENSKKLQSEAERTNALAEECQSARDSEMELNTKSRSDLAQITNERDEKDGELRQSNLKWMNTPQPQKMKPK
mmetsp:Transcript_27513/g.58480  ORF Transcript_27513/g.58480 Transcript_27513/m.58480 type:complete len:98 (-) Transcript_27513:633-926(-)